MRRGARRVERPDDLEDALREALGQTGPALVEIVSDPDPDLV